jgi:Domain of unknown function (DUF6046)
MGVTGNITPQVSAFDLSEVYKAAFGQRGIPLFPGLLLPDTSLPLLAEKYDPSVSEKNLANKAEDYNGKTILPGGQNGTKTEDYSEIKRIMPPASKAYSFRSGVMGVSYFMPVSFEVNGTTMTLPNEPMVTLRLSKTIVKTAVAGSGSRSSVKELIGFEDVKIQIDGIAINQQDPENWPEQHMATLMKIYNARKALKINCKLCELVGVSHVVIEGLDIKPQAGYQGSFPYSLQLVSDEDYAYTLLNS